MLPEGFSYRIVTEADRTLLESGEPTPGNYDGTCAFRTRGGGTVLVNNHEIGTPAEAAEDGIVTVPLIDGLVHDPGMGGGCTVVETERDGERVTEYVGVAGTSTNCAGGITPWDTWLTCEEDSTRAGQDGATKDHGYVFEVDPFDRGANRDPKPIKALGRHDHESATVGRKLEGQWWGDGGAYVVTSNARAEDSPGEPHDGQVWFYDPKLSTLTLKVRFGLNPAPDVDGAFDGPDNVTVSPWGGLILAEDGEGVQHLIGVAGNGETYPMARNDVDSTEFTGPVYSHDKRVLFANVQAPGTMFAITGPWRNQR